MKASEKLTQALTEARAPLRMIERARAGYYGDYSSPLALPITALVRDCEDLGLHDVARRAAHGEFDGV